MRTNSVSYGALQTAYDPNGEITRYLAKSIQRAMERHETMGASFADHVPTGGKLMFYPSGDKPAIIIEYSKRDSADELVRKINEAVGFDYAYIK